MGFKSRLQRIADWFQPAYNKIKAWELPPELSKTFDAVWNALSPDIQKGLWALLKVMHKKFGPEKAKELLAQAMNYLKGILNIDVDNS